MLEKKILVSKQILNFLTGIYNDEEENEELRKKKIFNRAFKMAYKDMATHTVAYHKEGEEYEKYIEGDNKRAINNREKVKDAIKNHIKGCFAEGQGYSLTNLLAIDSKDDFNKWHKKLCKKIVDINCDVEDLEAKDQSKNTVNISNLLCHVDKDITNTVFTYGQAQKLVNMMLKYLYIYYQCEGWNDLENLISYFHVPIDRYVLLKVSGQDNFKGKTWSKINDYDEEYMPCQTQIKEFVKKKYSTAFEWELAEWPFGMN